jgi:hypothetical protein
MGLPNARAIVVVALRARSAGGGFRWTRSVLARRVRLSPDEVHRALLELAEHGAVERAVRDEGGRPRELWRATEAAGRPASGCGEDGVEGGSASQVVSASYGAQDGGNRVLACRANSRGPSTPENTRGRGAPGGVRSHRVVGSEQQFLLGGSR